MALSHGDIAECKEIARIIVKEVIKEHINSCPHGQAMKTRWFLMIGLALGSGASSGGLVLAIAKLLA